MADPSHTPVNDRKYRGNTAAVHSKRIRAKQHEPAFAARKNQAQCKFASAGKAPWLSKKRTPALVKPPKKMTFLQVLIGVLRSKNHDDMPVKIHLRENGFYADPLEIVNHPHARRQVKQMQDLLKKRS